MVDVTQKIFQDMTRTFSRPFAQSSPDLTFVVVTGIELNWVWEGAMKSLFIEKKSMNQSKK